MNKKHNIFHGKFIKRDGKLHIAKDNLLYKLFVESLENGQNVSVFFESETESGSLTQLAKIHACIKELASELGYTFDEMKVVVKERAGLYILNEEGEKDIRSFKDASKSELMMVVQTLIQIGDTVGINFR